MDSRKVTRREALGLLSVSSAALSIGCGGGTEISPTAVTGATAGAPTAASSSSGGACAVAPSETLGPYPSLADFIRSDIREGKSGITLALTITVVNVNNNCAAVANATVDVWQCDAEGHYSQYAQPGYNGTGATFLRGIQLTNSGGQATFTTVYPGWYQGRATHIHVEVLENGASRKVTQIAFPESVNAAVYASGQYASRGQNPTTNTNDNVFSDSLASELATVSGDPAAGYVATFTVGIAV